MPKKRFLLILGILFLVLVGAAASLPFLVDANSFRPRVEAALSNALKREVKIGDLSLSVFSGAVTARDVSIADDAKYSTKPFVHSDSLALEVEMWPLISERKLNVTGVTVTHPEITLLEGAGGAWNFSSAGARTAIATGVPAAPLPASAMPDFSVKLIRVVNGRLVIGTAQGGDKPFTLEKVNITLHDVTPSSSIPFALTAKLASGGDLKIDGHAGPVNPADTSATPVDLTMKLSGANLAALSGDTDLAGVLTVSGSGKTDGNTLDWQGNVRIEKGKFVAAGRPAKEPVELDYTLRQDLRHHTGEITRGELRLGKASAALSGSLAQQGQGTTFNIHLVGKQMPIDSLTAMLPALNVQLPQGTSLAGGTLGIDVIASGSSAHPSVRGSLAVSKTQLRGFNLGAQMSELEHLIGIQSSPNMDIDEFRANVESSAAGTSLQNIHLVVPALGNVQGAGTVSPAKALNFKMRAMVHTRGAVMAAMGQAHDTAVPFSIEGTAADPVFRADVAAIAASELDRFTGTAGGNKIGGVDTGQAIDALKNLFGSKKKKQ